MNKRLLKLMGIAILAVVMNHASHPGFIAMFWWTDRYLPVTVPNYDQMGSLAYYGLVAAQKLAVFSVPAFLFIMGMFLSYAEHGSKSHLNWVMVRRRIVNLLPPYVIWTTFYWFVDFAIGNRQNLLDYALSFVTINQSIFFYIPLVIVYYLVSLILAPAAKKHPKLLLGIGGLVTGIGIVIGYLHLYARLNEVEQSILTSPITYFLERQVFEYFFYFVLGFIAGLNKERLKERISRFRWLLLGLTITAGIAAVVEAEWVYQSAEVMWRSRTLTLPSAIYAVSFILAFLAFEKVQFPNILYQLGTNTLGIYLIHKSVLLVAPKVVYHIFPFVLGVQILYMPLLITAGTGIPLLIMLVVRKTPIRKYYRIFFG
jgi:membrane-bound acyltransferase YfiQ involved in biofilm formation